MIVLFGPSSSEQILNPNNVLEDHLWGTVRKFVRFQVLITASDETDPMFDTGYSFLFLIGLILMGSGLISDDRRNRMDEIYDSKISRNTYLVGKFGSLFLFGNLLLVIPSVIEWVLLIVGIKGVDVIQAVPVLVGVILFTEIVLFCLTVVILSFSSLFTNRIYSGILAFAFFLAITNVFTSFSSNSQSFSPLMYLDLFTVLTILSFLLQGEQSVIYYNTINEVPFQISLDLTKDPGFLILPFLLIFFLLNCFLCYYQIVWTHKSPRSYLWRFIHNRTA
jgi:ABC-type transport system involved in multi-copper enzyme maturation permease subunit